MCFGTRPGCSEVTRRSGSRCFDLDLQYSPPTPTPARGRMDDTSSCRPLFLYSTVKSACLPIAWSFEPHRGYTRLGGMMTAVVAASESDT